MKERNWALWNSISCLRKFVNFKLRFVFVYIFAGRNLRLEAVLTLIRWHALITGPILRFNQRRKRNASSTPETGKGQTSRRRFNFNAKICFLNILRAKLKTLVELFASKSVKSTFSIFWQSWNSNRISISSALRKFHPRNSSVKCTHPRQKVRKSLPNEFTFQIHSVPPGRAEWSPFAESGQTGSTFSRKTSQVLVILAL